MVHPTVGVRGASAGRSSTGQDPGPVLHVGICNRRQRDPGWVKESARGAPGVGTGRQGSVAVGVTVGCEYEKTRDRETGEENGRSCG